MTINHDLSANDSHLTIRILGKFNAFDKELFVNCYKDNFHRISLVMINLAGARGLDTSSLAVFLQMKQLAERIGIKVSFFTGNNSQAKDLLVLGALGEYVVEPVIQEENTHEQPPISSESINEKD